MNIIARCPNCSAAWRLDKNAHDKRFKCPACKLLFKIPKAIELKIALELAESAKTPLYIDKNGRTFA
jgi:uncharacterized C2H2 Zn-finger protein